MRKIICIGLLGILLINCSNPTLEEKIQTVLENYEKQEVSSVEVIYTVSVGELNLRLTSLDSTFASLSQAKKELPIRLDAAQKRLEEATANLSKASHPALKYGFESVVEGEEKNISAFRQLIDKNNTLLEQNEGLRKSILKELKTAKDSIAYLIVKAQIGGVENNYKLSPALNIISSD